MEFLQVPNKMNKMVLLKEGKLYAGDRKGTEEGLELLMHIKGDRWFILPT